MKAFSCSVIGAILLVSAEVGMAQCTTHAELNKWERGQFLAAASGRRVYVSAQFLAEPGCGHEMLKALSQMGAKIHFADETAGYALLTIAREKLLDTLDIDGVAYAYTRDVGPYNEDPAVSVPPGEGRAESVPPIAIPYPRVAKSLSKDGPYFATDEIGLTQLWTQHPDADGRGVRVGVADEGFDLLHPAVREARDAAGRIVPKIVDLGTLMSPEEDSGWVHFGDPIQTKNGRFEAAGRTWIVPKDGKFRFGIFKQNLNLGFAGNSHTKSLSLSVGVLWDELSGHIWVDTNGDGSFKNQRAVRDYRIAQEIGWFGARRGEEDNRIPFGVKVDQARNAVYIRVGGEHGAFIAGSLAGNTLSGGLFNGAAPSAQLVDEASDRNHQIDPIVGLFGRSDVDVVNRSGAIAGAGFTGDLKGIEDFARHVLERMVTVYDKPIACYCAAANTIDVFDYAGPEMLRRNRQIGPPYLDTINSIAWFIPDGLVNTVLAPSANIDTQSRYDPFTLPWQDGTRRGPADRFEPSAPSGYTIGANMSPAIPVVSGVLADLISEARRQHVRYNTTRLNNAIFTGTRLLDGFPLSQQGYGLINAAQSWHQLVKMAEADDPANTELTSFAVSRIEDGHSIDVNGFYADLAKPGEKLESEIWITRRGGYGGGRKYTISLRGNYGSYELLDHDAVLIRDKAVRVRFYTNGTSGLNLVFLELRDEKANVVMEDVPLSVRVPEEPESVAPGVDRYRSTIQPLHSEYKYFRVGEEVQAARYVMRIPDTGSGNISTRWFPSFSHPAITVTSSGESVDAAHHVGPMQTFESLVANDEPGTQEVFWENRGRAEYATQRDGPTPDVAIQAEFTVSKYAVSIKKNANDSLTATNKLADIEGKIELYDATVKSAPIAGSGLHASGEIERALPANLAQWRVRVTSDSVSLGPADVYLLDCTGKSGCYVAAQQELSLGGKTAIIDKPQGGNWKIVVRSRGQVGRAATYTVREAFLVKGGVIDSNNSKHPSGESWTLPLPSEQSAARYAAFRIVGTPPNGHENNGPLIALTPLDGNAP